MSDVKTKTKILCVGIGGYAEIYLRELLEEKTPDFEIVGIVEIAPEGCRFFEELTKRGVKLYPDMEAFYAESRADLAILTTPIYLHKRQILCALHHGSDVMCEKPLSGESADEQEILDAMRKSGRFVSIGYQWSFSEAILGLKRDILNGVYGKAQYFKTIVLWPRPEAYFKRGSGWGGKRFAPDGTVMNDSVLNNATAHYLHNMLFVCGDRVDTSCEVKSVRGNLMRTNVIENFDTAVVDIELENGARCFCVVSHATEKGLDPCFEYRFEKGIVRFDSRDNEIVGETEDGTVRRYGNPFVDINRKIREAIRHAGDAEYHPPCGVSTAASHVRCIEKVQGLPIRTTRADRIGMREGFRYVYGLDALLKRCYEQELLLSDDPAYADVLEEES